MARILHVFNSYYFLGGEELAVEKIQELLEEEHEVEKCFFYSRDWKEAGAPSKWGQLRRMFYNPESRAQFEAACDRFQPDVALFHNIYPVGSPSLYHAAVLKGVPVMQYVHNFRPFSVGGTLHHRGVFTEEALRGNYWREIRGAVWQNSVLKSALMALLLKRLHRSGWLDQVKAWICVSDFMRQKFLKAGVSSERAFTLMHSWQPMQPAPKIEDHGYYLFLARLVDGKGVETLLDAWRRLESKLGPLTPELRVGGEGALAPLVVAAAQKSPKIKYLGLVKNEAKDTQIRHCRAMLAPSTWWEPLGLVTYEAYDYGKPILAAASGGLTETIRDGVTGLLHEPGSAESLMQSVERMEVMNAGTRMEMGAAGRSWLLRQTSSEEWKAGFNRILNTVINGKS